MPKIKAYKGNGLILPVDDAKVGVAYRCRWTNKVFGTKTAYLKHLKRIRSDIIHRNVRKRIRNRKFEELINVPTFEDMIAWIERNPEFVFDNVYPNGVPSYRNLPADVREKFWIKVTHLKVTHTDMASNSHSAPRGGVTCWSSREAEDGRPRGYPGWVGQIEFQLSHDLGFGSDVFRDLGIHTGSGGSIGNNRHGYGVTLFDSDWPGITEHFQKIAMWDKIADRRTDNAFRIGTPVYFRV